MDRQVARGHAAQALCAIIDNDGTLFTQDFRGRKTPVAKFTRNGNPINPLTCDTATQAQAVLKAHRQLGIVMPVFFEAEMANI